MVTQSLISLREADSEYGVGEGPIDEKSKSPPQAPVLDWRARKKKKTVNRKKEKEKKRDVGEEDRVVVIFIRRQRVSK